MEILKTILLRGVKEREFNTVRICLRTRVMDYQRGDTVCEYGNGSSRIGVILSGRAAVFRTDVNGVEYMLEYLGEGSIFSELISFGKNIGDSIHVKTMSKAEIVYLDYKRIRSGCDDCKSPCGVGEKLSDNLITALIERGEMLSERAEVLTCSSIRDKLLCYFKLLSARSRHGVVELPFTWGELALYINSDRAAMTREVANMVRDELITTKGRRIVMKKQ